MKCILFLFTFHFQAWPDDALEMVANKFLADVEMEDDIRKASVIMCKSFHESVRLLSERYVDITINSILVVFEFY